MISPPRAARAWALLGGSVCFELPSAALPALSTWLANVQEFYSRRANLPSERAKTMTVAELIEELRSMPRDAPVALRTTLPNQRVRWDDLERIEHRSLHGLPPVVLLR